MTLEETVSLAIKEAISLPAKIAKFPVGEMSLESSLFDSSYLEFLDTQIRLAPRGPEWTARLRRRRAELAPFCNRPLIRGAPRSDNSWFTIYVDPEANCIIHWEIY